ncbi:hypothetical protein MUK42_09856 [Musa troglodytarum]|uniref:Methyltransferase n=1 Tax=Musa troglodytarum TaxID=320322 RepID=A0A9E7EKZ0_9LILI|nr:hypothetical protein MUK42_09856 [Musa troglodytarum]
MAHVNLPQGRRWPGRPRWGVLDLVSAALFTAVFVLLVLIVTSLGDSLAASGRRALARSAAGSRQRERIVALLDSPTASPFAIDSCPAEEVDNMPCEDPRRNSQLSREMNFYRVRHCPLPGETPLCLVPPPKGYRIPVPWPESLHKIWHDNMPYNKIAERKGHQGWMKEEGPYFIFPDGTYLIEVDRLLRPEGYLVISGPPVQWAIQDKEWADLQAMVHALYFKLRKCITKVPLSEEISLSAIPEWPQRLSKTPARISLMKNGIDMFEADTQHWARRVIYYKKSLGVELGSPRICNVMDMNAFIGGFAAALSSDPVWIMNVVPARNPLTLDIIYDRGLIGLYHDWCEAFSTYPRTYDLIHVAGINSLIRDTTSGNDRCSLVDLMVEMDRMLRPQGTAVVRDTPEVIDRVARPCDPVDGPGAQE